MQTPWHLSYDGVDFEFGTAESRYVFESAPAIGTADLTVDDSKMPRADGVAFGQDFRAGTTITFGITVDGQDETDARSLLLPLATAWRADAVRSKPGVVAELTSHTGRTAFGRPRRFATNDDLAPFGVTAVTADFATVDDLWYGPEQIETVALKPPLGGGLIAPLRSPLATTANSDRSTTITVDGTASVWPVITLQGAITNPVIEVVGVFRLAFNLTLKYDQTLVIDTRPWARSILRDGVSVAGSLIPTSSRLSQTSVPPGTYELALRGQSDASPMATFAWRAAYPTY